MRVKKGFLPVCCVALACATAGLAAEDAKVCPNEMDLAAFHDGKVIIPCGHQGMLMQK